MKQVFLIGDSVRQGYDSFVAQAMCQQARVQYPDDNSMYALHVLRWLSQYKSRYAIPDDVDCIHWNAGLWDTLTMEDIGIVTPLPFYEDCIERICLRMKRLFPQGKFVFATSTPVLEHRFAQSDGVIRYNRDIQRYNEAAVRIVRAHGHAVDDLYAVLAGVPDSYYDGPTHPYTREGTQLLTAAVVRSIAQCIGVSVPPVAVDAVVSKHFLGQ